MKVLKSLEDVEAAGLSPPLRALAERVVRNLVDVNAEYGECYEPEHVKLQFHVHLRCETSVSQRGSITMIDNITSNGLS